MLLLGAGLPGLVYLLLLVLLLVAPEEGLAMGAVVMGALSLFGLLLGGLLALPRRPFGLSPRRVLAAFLLVLLLGGLLIASGLSFLIAIGLPPLHLAGALLPALLALALARGGPARVEGDAGTAPPPIHRDTPPPDDGPPHDPPAERPEAETSDPDTALNSSLSDDPLVDAPGAAMTGPLPAPGADRPALTWSTAAAGLAWGGCAATLLALLVESLLGLLILALLLVVWPQAPELLAAVGASMAEGGQPNAEAQAALLRRLVAEPALLLALWLLMGILAPFTEELTKLLGPAWRSERGRAGAVTEARSGRQQAWWRGVAVGAGFGVFEALFYSGMVLQAPAWALAVALRACTTLVHGIFTGAASLGWHLLRIEGRPRPALLGILGAFLGHALWNSLALGAVVAGLQAGGSQDGPPTGPLAGALAVGVVLTFYGLLAFFGITSRRLARG